MQRITNTLSPNLTANAEAGNIVYESNTRKHLHVGKDAQELINLCTSLRDHFDTIYEEKIFDLYIVPTVGAALETVANDRLPAEAAIALFVLDDKKLSLLVLGDSGAGKTLLSKRIARDYWNKAFTNLVSIDEAELPVLIPIWIWLPSIQDAKDRESCLLKKQLEKILFSDTKINLFRQYCQKGYIKLVIILDGFDEISTPKESMYITNDWLNDWCAPKVVTLSRPEVFSSKHINNYEHLFHASKNSALFEQCYLQGFDDEQVQSYIKNYIVNSKSDKIERQLTPYWQNWENYYQHITNIQPLAELTRNPYLLSILVGVLPILGHKFVLNYNVIPRDEEVDYGTLYLYLKNDELEYAVINTLDQVKRRIISSIEYNNSVKFEVVKNVLRDSSKAELIPSEAYECLLDYMSSEGYAPRLDDNKLIAVDNRFKTEYSRLKIYETFVNNWLERQVDRLLSDEIKAAQLREKYKYSKESNMDESVCFKHDLKKCMHIYSENLARYVLNKGQGKLDVFITEEDTLREELLLPKYGEKPFFQRVMNLPIQLIRSGCLLKANSDTYSFLHKSIAEYLATKTVFKSLYTLVDFLNELKSKMEENDSVDKVDTKVIFKNIKNDFDLNKNLLLNEPKIISFFADIVKADPIFKEMLYNTVYYSKDYPQVKIAAANAITILKVAGEVFSGLDFSGINIEGADLSEAICDGTNFSEANLKNVNLYNAWIRNVNFNRANMQGIGIIYPNILGPNLDECIFRLIMHPNNEWLITVNLTGEIANWSLPDLTRFCSSQFQLEGIKHITLSPDNETILIITNNYPYVYMLDVRTLNIINKNIVHAINSRLLDLAENNIVRMEFLGNTNYRFLILNQDSLFIYDIRQGYKKIYIESLNNLDRTQDMIDFSISRKGELIAVLTSTKDLEYFSRVCVVKNISLTIKNGIYSDSETSKELEGSYKVISASHSGNLLVCAGKRHNKSIIHLYNSDNLELEKTFQLDDVSKVINIITFSLEDKLLIYAGQDFVSVFDLDSCQSLYTLQINDIQFTCSNEFLCYSNAKQIRLKRLLDARIYDTVNNPKKYLPYLSEEIKLHHPKQCTCTYDYPLGMYPTDVTYHAAVNNINNYDYDANPETKIHVTFSQKNIVPLNEKVAITPMSLNQIIKVMTCSMDWELNIFKNDVIYKTSLISTPPQPPFCFTVASNRYLVLAWIKRLLLFTGQMKINVFDLKLLKVVEFEQPPANVFAYSDDGKWLFAASKNEVTCYDLHEGKKFRCFKNVFQSSTLTEYEDQHYTKISLTYSTDKKMLVACKYCMIGKRSIIVSVLNIETKRCLYTDNIHILSFSDNLGDLEIFELTFASDEENIQFLKLLINNHLFVFSLSYNLNSTEFSLRLIYSSESTGLIADNANLEKSIFLSHAELRVLKDYGAIGEPVCLGDKTTVNEVTDPRQHKHAIIQQKANSVLCPKLQIDYDTCVVSLLRDPLASDTKHVYIIIEAMNVWGRLVFYRYELVTWKDGEPVDSAGNAQITEIKSPNPMLIKHHEKELNSILVQHGSKNRRRGALSVCGRSWEISKTHARDLKRDIKNDTAQNGETIILPYNVLGISLFGKKYNCYTWAREKLLKLNIPIINQFLQSSNSDSLIVNPTTKLDVFPDEEPEEKNKLSQSGSKQCHII